MKSKTNELVGKALDWAVAKCEGYKPVAVLNYSTCWEHGGPIIEREELCVRPPRNTKLANGMVLGKREHGWFATTYTDYGDDIGSMPSISRFGPTPLIAAMRCYVASKLGDEVDVPEELK